MAKRRLSLDERELDLLREAVDYHYLYNLVGYGVAYDDLGEADQEMHDGLVALYARLAEQPA